VMVGAESRELEDALLRAGAAVVRTRVVAEKTLRGLLALGLIVLVEGKVESDVQGFAILDAAGFASSGELLRHLLLSGEGSSR